MSDTTQLAITGGEPVRRKPLSGWPRGYEEGRKAINDVLDGGRWCRRGGEPGYGQKVEEWLIQLHKAAGAVMVTNGTHALEVALQGLGLEPGDQVLVPAITFIATATAVSRLGAEPVPVDVLPENLCIDPADAERKITSRARVIIPVHLAGCPADMGSIVEIGRARGLYILEDCAQALGAEWRGSVVGSFGDASTYSFQAGKIITAGEGGAIVVCRDRALLERIQMITDCGVRPGHKWYEHELIGSNYRMTEFQAALIMSQVPAFSDWLVMRRDSALALVKSLEQLGVNCPTGASHPDVTLHVWSSLSLRLPEIVTGTFDSREIASILQAEGIQVQPLYTPWYSTTAYSGLYGLCPVAEEAARTTVFLHFSLLLAGEEALSDTTRAIEKLINWCRNSSPAQKTRVQQMITNSHGKSAARAGDIR